MDPTPGPLTREHALMPEMKQMPEAADLVRQHKRNARVVFDRAA